MSLLTQMKLLLKLDVMLKEKTGRVTFMPLNRLKPKNPPAPNSPEAEPLLEKLRFDRKYENAFQQVFGKTCVCRDLTIAAAYEYFHQRQTSSPGFVSWSVLFFSNLYYILILICREKQVAASLLGTHTRTIPIY